MARKLKTFQTSLGFYELAIAAPSMKAAIEAWGADPDIFRQGFAKQTNDPAIVNAAEASPGTVLRRAVGSTGKFSANAKLPKAPTEAPSTRSSSEGGAKAKSEIDLKKAEAELG